MYLSAICRTLEKSSKWSSSVTFYMRLFHSGMNCRICTPLKSGIPIRINENPT
jgi:hypothetical protein